MWSREEIAWRGPLLPLLVAAAAPRSGVQDETVNAFEIDGRHAVAAPMINWPADDELQMRSGFCRRVPAILTLRLMKAIMRDGLGGTHDGEGTMGTSAPLHRYGIIETIFHVSLRRSLKDGTYLSAPRERTWSARPGAAQVGCF